MIFFEKNLAIFSVKKKEIIPLINTTRIINSKKFKEGVPMVSFIAIATPVLVFEII